MLTLGQEKYLNSLSEEILSRPVAISPWGPQAKDIAHRVIEEIHNKVPDLSIELVGSAALEIAGEKDIDISVYCPVSDQPRYYNAFQELFGSHVWEGPSHMGWKDDRDSYQVGVWLTDPSLSTTTQAQSKLFSIFKEKPELVAEYEQIKLSMNGKSFREYQIAKYEFYNRVLGISEI